MFHSSEFDFLIKFLFTTLPLVDWTLGFFSGTIYVSINYLINYGKAGGTHSPHLAARFIVFTLHRGLDWYYTTGG